MSGIKTLSIDIETYSGYDLNKCGVYKYVEHPDFDILLFGYAVNGGLEGAGAVLGLEEQKLKEGHEPIRYFCVPCKPTKANGGRERNLPEHDREKWSLFKSYNRRDVEVEMSIQKRLANYPVPDFVWDEYHLDREINDRGIALDMRVVKEAIILDGETREELQDAMKALTGLDNPNSVAQIPSLPLEKVETES